MMQPKTMMRSHKKEWENFTNTYWELSDNEENQEQYDKSLNRKQRENHTITIIQNIQHNPVPNIAANIFYNNRNATKEYQIK